MSPERLKGRLPKGQRRRIRKLKTQIHQELGLTLSQVDSRLWDQTVEILRREIPDFETRIVPHLYLINEFFSLRKRINEGESISAVDDFYHKHDKQLLKDLSPAFSIVRRTLTPKR